MPFAVVNHVRLDDPQRSATSTREVVLPRLRQLPGFDQAIFVARADGRGFNVMVFETREQAEAMAERLGGEVPAPDAITFERQEVLEVVART